MPSGIASQRKYRNSECVFYVHKSEKTLISLDMRNILIMGILGVAAIGCGSDYGPNQRTSTAFTMPRPPSALAFTMPRPPGALAFTMPRPPGTLAFTMPRPPSALAFTMVADSLC
jgi:hypothetical protein